MRCGKSCWSTTCAWSASSPAPSPPSCPSTFSDPKTRQETRSEILTAEDVASLIVYAVTAPERVSVNEVLLRPLRQVN
jgi:NADP-dependent 3-hydroxy acid dehydrogenase YdfG